MSHPKLYLLVGYPGAGKTTTAKIIHEATGATHLWADHVRWQMFKQPRHSDAESHKLYSYLNNLTAKLLRSGTSVIFDTNFNYRSDRDHLRKIAQDNGAQTVLIWLTTPINIARERAVHNHTTRNGYTVNMTNEMFQSITDKLEQPTEDENPIKIDGTKLDTVALSAQFSKYDGAAIKQN